jgi:Holliday junction resolvase RusA-like endonuclease
MAWIAGEVIRIEIPGSPKAVPRQRHRIVTPKNKPAFVHNYQVSDSRNEAAVIRDFAQQAMNKQPPIEGPVELRFVCYMPVPPGWSMKKQRAALADQIRPHGRPDVDNLLRRVDSFKKVIWRDDSQITDAAVWKRYSDRPRVVVEIRPLVFQQAQPAAKSRVANRGNAHPPSTALAS